jgi:hypothetical protein
VIRTATGTQCTGYLRGFKVGVGLPAISSARIVYCRGGYNRIVEPDGYILEGSSLINWNTM